MSRNISSFIRGLQDSLKYRRVIVQKLFKAKNYQFSNFKTLAYNLQPKLKSQINIESYPSDAESTELQRSPNLHYKLSRVSSERAPSLSEITSKRTRVRHCCSLQRRPEVQAPGIFRLQRTTARKTVAQATL